MSAGAVKLRAVLTWMALMPVLAAVPLSIVWKQQAYVRLSRALVQADKDRGELQTAVLLLETDVRALGQLSRLESVARDRLGLVDPGPPIVIQPEGQILADAGSAAKPAAIKTAFWKGIFPWRTSGF